MRPSWITQVLIVLAVGESLVASGCGKSTSGTSPDGALIGGNGGARAGGAPDASCVGGTTGRTGSAASGSTVGSGGVTVASGGATSFGSTGAADAGAGSDGGEGASSIDGSTGSDDLGGSTEAAVVKFTLPECPPGPLREFLVIGANLRRPITQARRRPRQNGLCLLQSAGWRAHARPAGAPRGRVEPGRRRRRRARAVRIPGGVTSASPHENTHGLGCRARGEVRTELR